MLKKVLFSAFFVCFLTVGGFAQVNDMSATYKGTVGNVKITMTILIGAII